MSPGVAAWDAVSSTCVTCYLWGSLPPLWPSWSHSRRSIVVSVGLVRTPGTIPGEGGGGGFVAQSYRAFCFISASCIVRMYG